MLPNDLEETKQAGIYPCHMGGHITYSASYRNEEIAQ
ncbi:unnamed protein product, partial [Vitis vinifera]